MNDNEKLFFEHRKIAKNIAIFYSRKYHKPIEETTNNAEFALCLLLYGDNALKFDPEKQSISTWLGIKIYWYMKDVYERGHWCGCADLAEPRSFKEIQDDDLFQKWESGHNVYSYNAENKNPNIVAPQEFTIGYSWFQNLLEEVSEESIALLQIIADAPKDLLLEIMPQKGRTAKRKKQNLYEYLVDVLDWKPETVEKAFCEIQAAL